MTDGQAHFLGGPVGRGLRLAVAGLAGALAAGCSNLDLFADKPQAAAPPPDSALADTLNDATRQAAASGSGQVLSGPVALPMPIRLVPDSSGLAKPETPPSSYSVNTAGMAGDVRRSIPGGGARPGIAVVPLPGTGAAGLPAAVPPAAPAASPPPIPITPIPAAEAPRPLAAVPPPPLPQPVPVASAAGPEPRYRVQIGAFPTRQDAEDNWVHLKREPLLGALAPVYRPIEPPDAHGLAWRLQVGGYESRPAAEEFCQSLLRKRIDCWVYAVPRRS